MSELLRFFKDMRDNGYGLAEIAAQLGTSAIAEPVAGFAAMYDPAHGADAIREGMTYQPRTQEAQQYSQSVGNAASAAIKPAMPIIDTWKKGVDIAGQYSPVVGAGLRTVPAAIGIAMGAKPALQAGRQVSKGLESMQGRMIANATAPSTLNTAGFRGQRGAIGTETPKIKQISDNWESQGVRNSVSENGNRVMLSQVIVPKELRNQGIGSKYMRELIDYADSVGKRVELSPSADFGGNKNKLKEFYSRFGFVENKGRNKDFEISESMYRPSRPIAPQRPLTEFEQAHLTAQRNAALPVNQGGLGLPANNTAMDRARAMGFDVDNPVYHGTGADFPNFQGSTTGKTRGSGVFFTENPSVASTYASSNGGSVIPAVLRTESPVQVSTNGANWNWIKKDAKVDAPRITVADTEGDELMAELFGDSSPVSIQKKAFKKTVGKLFPEDFKYDDHITTDDLARWANKEGYDSISFDSIKDRGPSGIFANAESALPSKNTAAFDPKNIRSRFAAFDPMQRQSSNLLAQSAKLAPTTALGAYMYNEKRKKSQGNQ